MSAKRDEIAQAMADHQVIIVCGETGSGKTTQLPKIALALGRGKCNAKPGQKGQLIGHTQPRRIAASSTAKRIAVELGSPLGEHVGFGHHGQAGIACPANQRRARQRHQRQARVHRQERGDHVVEARKVSFGGLKAQLGLVTPAVKAGDVGGFF